MQVIKRDNSKQEFDKQKIAKVVHAAGLPKQKANALANKVEEWVEKHAKKGKKQISSLEIKDKVSKLLKKENYYAWGLYTWYEKTKSKNNL